MLQSYHIQPFQIIVKGLIVVVIKLDELLSLSDDKISLTLFKINKLLKNCLLKRAA